MKVLKTRVEPTLTLCQKVKVNKEKTLFSGQKMESQTNDINGDRKGAIKLDANRITSVTFPRYVDPNVKDDMVNPSLENSSECAV